MFRLLSRLSEHIFVGLCLASLSLLFGSLAALLRLLPQLLTFLRFCLRGFLILSIRLYRLLFSRLAPVCQQYLEVNLLANPARMVASVLLSLAVGLLVICLAGLPVTVWSVLPCLVHGVSVGIAWSELEETGGIQLGTRL